MANKQKYLGSKRIRRRFHVRSKMRGESGRPRMCIYRSHKHMGCQLIDDATGKTLVSASTRDKDLREQLKYGGNCDAAKEIGRVVGERAMEAGIKQVCFDRGSYKYHGRVAALADAAREVGLQF